MASAVHNVQGPSDIPTGQDLRDGAGAIDAALADTIAKTRWTSATSPCTVPCWWGESIDNTNFPVGTWRYRYFTASRGERIRVAISWWSNADCASESSCNYDRLDTNLNLTLFYPNGQFVSSGSYDNNYELVDFVAPQTGQYQIGVYKYSANETSNFLGIAWVKDAIYLPDLRNQDGWVSEFYVRNDGAVSRSAQFGPMPPVTIHYFDANGNPTVSDSCNLGRNWVCWIPVDQNNRIPANSTGSAIVGGGEDVTVVVETQKNNNTERTNYTGVLPNGGSGSVGWEQAGATLYAPVIKRQFYGRSSTIHLVNAGTQSTQAYVVYYDDSTGVGRSTGPYSLNPNAKVPISPSGSGSGGCNGSNTLCSARIYSTNGQPLAGVVQEYNDANGLVVTTHNLFSAGASSIYFPVVKYQFYNMTTGLRIQNVGSASTTVTVRYYRQDGTQACFLSASIPSLSAATFLSSTCPGNNFLGSAVATASQPLAGMANEASTDGRLKKSYSSFQGGSHTAYATLAYRTFLQAGYTWDSGSTVQNLSTEPANVTLLYYDGLGSSAGSQNQVIAGRGLGVFFAPQSNFKGSAVITADRDIAVVVNVINDAPSGDTHAIYNASSR